MNSTKTTTTTTTTVTTVTTVTTLPAEKDTLQLRAELGTTFLGWAEDYLKSRIGQKFNFDNAFDDYNQYCLKTFDRILLRITRRKFKNNIKLWSQLHELDFTDRILEKVDEKTVELLLIGDCVEQNQKSEYFQIEKQQ